MNRIEINVQTGERQVIPLTPAELADARARKAKEDAAPPRPPSFEQRLAACEKALGL